MYSKYIVLIDKNKKLPERTCLLEQAWGKHMPISFIQDSEQLNEGTYLDVKVNKWELNKKWSDIQNEEPWIRIEILKDEAFESFFNEERCQLSLDFKKCFLVVLQLDEGFLEIDQLLLARLVKIIADTHQCYAYDSSSSYVNCKELLKLLPPKEAVKKQCIVGP